MASNLITIAALAIGAFGLLMFFAGLFDGSNTTIDMLLGSIMVLTAYYVFTTGEIMAKGSIFSHCRSSGNIIVYVQRTAPASVHCVTAEKLRTIGL
jgi:hypothetical protein